MKTNFRVTHKMSGLLFSALLCLLTATPFHAKAETPDVSPEAADSIATPMEMAEPDTVVSPAVKKILFIGDSMTGWMAERLNAYGDINGFEVATVVWDGSTISKWANSGALPRLISRNSPDAVIISLGMNEMFEQRPEARLSKPVDKIISEIDSIPYLWIGPPSWPGHQEGRKFNDWLASRLGDRNFFYSFHLPLSRQSKSNPHPSRKGIEDWIDMVVEWIPENSSIDLPPLNRPEEGKLSRGKTFIYKRMKEKL